MNGAAATGRAHRILAVMPRGCGASSTPRPLGPTVDVSGILDRPVKPVADGKPGPMTNRLREIYVEFAKATAV